MNGTYLVHYASKYYDPVKAHEYYEEHKKLKGRTSTAGLNEEGRIAAQYIRKNINDERDKNIEVAKATTKSQIETDKANLESQKSQRESEMRQHTEQAQKQIDSIRERIQKMSPRQRELASNVLGKQIESIRNANNSQRQKVTADISRLREENSQKRQALNEKLRADTKGFRDDAKSRYESELDALRSDPKYAKKSKGSGSSGPGHSKEFEKVQEAIKNRKKSK